jgi:hypothetical protein
MTDVAEHDVKRDVIERQRLRVAFPKIDLHIRDTRVLACPLEQLRRKINTAHPCADPCGGDGGYAGATADIKNLLPDKNVHKLHQTRRRRRRQRLKWREMFPALSLRFFEFGNGIFAHASITFCLYLCCRSNENELSYR